MPGLPPLLILAGPTGSGKTDLALVLAREFGGEIVNCDSVQIYRFFNIGSAKLPLESRNGIPHHLIDIAEPVQPFTAGDFSRWARRVIAEISARGRLPIVVGGTGFYIQALLEGLFPDSSRDESLRRRLAARRPPSLHRILSRLDPVSAGRIHPNDTKKLIRALEVTIVARRPLSVMFGSGRDVLTGYQVLKVALDPPRDKLYRRLEERAERMFEQGQGIVEETQSILARGVPAEAKPFESLGYKQALTFLRGDITREQAVAETQLHTRRYAKRQWTWFRRDAGFEWFPGFGDDPETQRQVLSRVRMLAQ